MTTKEILPFEATHPGTLILDEIKARDIKQKDLNLIIELVTRSLFHERLQLIFRVEILMVD